jgi:hypothetical protein
MAKKQEEPQRPHLHAYIMWGVALLLSACIAVVGFFVKPTGISATNTVDSNIASVPGNQNSVTVQAPAREGRRPSAGFGCDNSKGVKMYGNYSHDNAGEGFGIHNNCDDAEITGNISEHNGYPLSRSWSAVTDRRFPAPWTVEEYRGISYIVRDANNFAVACVEVLCPLTKPHRVSKVPRNEKAPAVVASAGASWSASVRDADAFADALFVPNGDDCVVGCIWCAGAGLDNITDFYRRYKPLILRRFSDGTDFAFKVQSFGVPW